MSAKNDDMQALQKALLFSLGITAPSVFLYLAVGNALGPRYYLLSPLVGCFLSAAIIVKGTRLDESETGSDRFQLGCLISGGVFMGVGLVAFLVFELAHEIGAFRQTVASLQTLLLVVSLFYLVLLGVPLGSWVVRRRAESRTADNTPHAPVWPTLVLLGAGGILTGVFSAMGESVLAARKADEELQTATPEEAVALFLGGRAEFIDPEAPELAKDRLEHWWITLVKSGVAGEWTRPGDRYYVRAEDVSLGSVYGLELQEQPRSEQWKDSLTSGRAGRVFSFRAYCSFSAKTSGFDKIEFSRSDWVFQGQVFVADSRAGWRVHDIAFFPVYRGDLLHSPTDKRWIH